MQFLSLQFSSTAVMIEPPGEATLTNQDSDSELSDAEESGCSAAVGKTTTALSVW